MSEILNFSPELKAKPENPQYRVDFEAVNNFLPRFNTTEMCLLADMLSPRVQKSK